MYCRPGSHQFAHLTSPNLPVGMKQVTSSHKEGSDHASAIKRNGGHEKHEN